MHRKTEGTSGEKIEINGIIGMKGNEVMKSFDYRHEWQPKGRK